MLQDNLPLFQIQNTPEAVAWVTEAKAILKASGNPPWPHDIGKALVGNPVAVTFMLGACAKEAIQLTYQPDIVLTFAHAFAAIRSEEAHNQLLATPVLPIRRPVPHDKLFAQMANDLVEITRELAAGKPDVLHIGGFFGFYAMCVLQYNMDTGNTGLTGTAEDREGTMFRLGFLLNLMLDKERKGLYNRS